MKTLSTWPRATPAASISSRKDGLRTVFRLALDNGASGIMGTGRLFEGVNLTFNDIPHSSLTWKSSEPRSFISNGASRAAAR